MGAPKRSCRTCVWRLVNAGSNKGLHCGYSLCLTHHSRIWLHYQRTGRESLDRMTSDADCTEWMPGNPKDKLSLLQDDPAMVTDKAWALLARERGIEPSAKKKVERKNYCTTIALDMQKAKMLKSMHKWREIAEVAGVGISTIESYWERQRINKHAAKRLKEAFGIDITTGGKQK
nr:MAG TPA: DNA-binding transcriptional regulator [Caudoviricetes sp.]